MAVRENVKTDLTRINSLTSFHDYLQFGRMLHPVVGPNDSGKKLWHFSMAPPTQRSVKARGGHPNLGFCIFSCQTPDTKTQPCFERPTQHLKVKYGNLN